MPAHNFIDHTGLVYNGIEILRRDPLDARKEFGTVWDMRCYCGKEFKNYISLIKRGVVRSCGCIKQNQRAHGYEDIAGQQYGYLTAVAYAGIEKNKSGRGSRTIWTFKCVCGVVKKYHKNNVVNGNTQSCGCMKSTLARKKRILKDNMAVFNNAYNSHKHAAKKRNYPSFLSFDEYHSIVKKPCHYCGDFSRRKTSQDRRQKLAASVSANSVDRLNNEPYYKLQNSVPCCFVCQKMKGTLQLKEFLSKIKKIYTKLGAF